MDPTPFHHTMGTIWHSQPGSAGAAFQFAPQDTRSFYEAVGWKAQEFHSTGWSPSDWGELHCTAGAAWDAMWNWSAPAAQAALKRTSASRC
jgi:hypothetical protein